MNHQPLQYYMHDAPTCFRFALTGNLNREATCRLDQDWRTASSAIGGRSLVVDITCVTDIDEHGRALINRWHSEGARLIANSKRSLALAESILGEPLSEPLEKVPSIVSGRTWPLFPGSFLARAFILALLAMIAFPIEATAATLKDQTVVDWDNYLQSVNSNLQDRLRSGGTFLWTFEDPERATKVHSGEIVVAPVGQNPKKVSDGLIHHWIGAVFVPNLKMDDILKVTRDYDQYKEFYHPSVVESKVVSRDSTEDKFWMLLMNKAFFLKTALETDCLASNVRLDDHRFYSISRTTRVQEVEEYGQPGEYRKPEGEGSGYIWKLYTIARFEEHDDGVYIELEAMALSRKIPAAFRVVVDPIVRRVSRNSLLISLKQTTEAVNGRPADVSRSTVIPANASRSSR
jgi:hypothetical protein